MGSLSQYFFMRNYDAIPAGANLLVIENLTTEGHPFII